MNMVRFSAYNGDALVAQTEWVPEHDRTSAPNLLGEFRKAHPNFAYRIEREGDSKIPNLRLLTRVTIRDGQNIYYSRSFEEHEANERIAEIREKWPKADIVVEKRNG